MHSESKPPNSSPKSIPPEIAVSGDPDVPGHILPDPTAGEQRTILERWGISIGELTRLVDENPSLRGIMLGYVAEHKFREIIEKHPHIAGSKKFDDHDRKQKSDRVIIYKGVEFSVEVKSLQTNKVKREGEIWKGCAQVDASDRRTIRFPDGTTLNTTLLLRGEFDILAVNCFAFGNTWRFAFALNSELPHSKFAKYAKVQRTQLIASLIPVSWPPVAPFVADPFELVERLYRESTRQHAR